MSEKNHNMVKIFLKNFLRTKKNNLNKWSFCVSISMEKSIL